jgi:hypothetical protein
MNKNLLWIFSLKNEVLAFLEHQKSKSVKGYYKYSFSGDLYDENTHWNVGSSVFALRCYYSLGVERNSDINDAIHYIKTFRDDKLIYDKLIYKKSFLRNVLVSLKSHDFNNLINFKYKNAETRQCLSSLLLYDEMPDDIILDIPINKIEIYKYLSSLQWEEPWGAGSHFSHLMFFNKTALKTGQINNEEFKRNITNARKWIESIQCSKTGGWFKGNPEKRNIINGAMKVITGLIAVDIKEIYFAKELVDTCLISANNEHACDNFNIILVLHFLNKQLKNNYRYEEIKIFALDRLSKYKAHYKNKQGGFSFYPCHTNERYYGAKITKGKNEPDIHGTFLFLYGISLIAEILNINDALGFKVYSS